MGIIQKLDYLASTKLAIADAIIEKGQPVGSNDTFRSYSDRILDIQTGGGGGGSGPIQVASMQLLSNMRTMPYFTDVTEVN